MITWNNFDWFALLSIALWGSGAAFALFSKERNRWAILLTLMGTLVFAVFIAGFWIYLQRPPLRTMGETRLWYSFFMGISGLLTYIRWKYPWILSFSTVVGAVFALINILKPEIHDQSLMPALQSPWFVPHVTVYMFSYSVLGCAFILACMGLYKHRENYLEAADISQEHSAYTVLDTDCVFSFATNVLVWSELPSSRTAKRTFIQPFLAF